MGNLTLWSSTPHCRRRRAGHNPRVHRDDRPGLRACPRGPSPGRRRASWQPRVHAWVVRPPALLRQHIRVQDDWCAKKSRPGPQFGVPTFMSEAAPSLEPYSCGLCCPVQVCLDANSLRMRGSGSTLKVFPQLHDDLCVIAAGCHHVCDRTCRYRSLAPGGTVCRLTQTFFKWDEQSVLGKGERWATLTATAYHSPSTMQRRPSWKKANLDFHNFQLRQVAI